MAKVAVIGAGMAGLAAASELLHSLKNAQITLLEASDRVGGRAYTTRIGNEPIDWGCEALEGDADSETSKLFKSFAHPIDGPAENDPLIVKLDDDLADDALNDQVLMTSTVSADMEANAVAAGELYEREKAKKKPGQWVHPEGEADSLLRGVNLGHGSDRIAALLSQYGGSFAESSLLGQSSAWDRGRAMSLQGELGGGGGGGGGGDDSGAYFAKGLGATVGEWAAAHVLNRAGLTNRLGWPVGIVRNVEASGERRVDVVNANGAATLSFDAAIITVPTTVIASGALVVEGMTKAQKGAFADCPLGHYHKIAVTGAPPITGLARNTRIYVCDSKLEYTFFITASPKNGYYMAHVAGEAGKRCNDDPRWAEQTFLTFLDYLHGAKVPRAALKFHHSDWHSNPCFGGAYSYSKVGKGHARETLSDLTIGAIYFAGEACSLKWYGSLEGAMATGTRAAKRVVELLDG